MSEWQTIDTAPIDGSWFVICRVGDADFCEVGRYMPLQVEQYVEEPGGLYRKVQKQFFDWEGFDNLHRATHWMPVKLP